MFCFCTEIIKCASLIIFSVKSVRQLRIYITTYLSIRHLDLEGFEDNKVILKEEPAFFQDSADSRYKIYLGPYFSSGKWVNNVFKEANVRKMGKQSEWVKCFNQISTTVIAYY